MPIHVNSPRPPLSVIVPLADLLPEFREGIEVARTDSGWDQNRLQQAVRRSFDFLAPYTVAQVAARTTATGTTEELLVLDFSGSGERDIVGTERAFDKATRRAQRGDARGALPELERIALEIPEVAKYHRALGQAYLVLGKADRAEDELLRGLALDPRDSDALTLLGNLYMQSGRPEQALPLYKRSSEVEPNVYALTNTGAALAKLGNLDEAIATLRRATDLDETYADSWYGLGLALSQKRDPALLSAAIEALEKAARVRGSSSEHTAVRESARQLLASLSRLDANETWRRDGEALITRVIGEPIQGNDLPIRLEEGAPTGALAKIEFGWAHKRNFHRVLTGGSPGPTRAHLVLHELEHLRLTSVARAAGRNRWFATSASEESFARHAVQADLARIAKRTGNEHQARAFAQFAIPGLLSQLYNFPVDFLIEDRLLARYPHLRELMYQSIAAQLETARRILHDRDIAAMTPRTVFRANAAMNGAFAYWLESRFPGRTDIAADFDRAETGALSRALFNHWTRAVERWEPGAELGWIDEWAASLGLKGWYTWVDDPVGPAGKQAEIVEP